MPLIQHLDRPVVANQTTAAETHPITYPCIGRVGKFRGRQNAAFRPEMKKSAVAAEVRCPFLAAGVIYALVERQRLVVFEGKVAKQFSDHSPAPRASVPILFMRRFMSRRRPS